MATEKKKKKKKFTFVKGSNPSIVWDPETNAPLAAFQDPKTNRVVGTFTTTDVEVAKKLRKLGYKERKDFPEGAPPGGFEEFVHEPPDHITPGGPPPASMKGKDIIVKEPEGKSVTNETSSGKTKLKKKKDMEVSEKKTSKKKKKKLVNTSKKKKTSKSSD